jgi:hypothetical protein
VFEEMIGSEPVPEYLDKRLGWRVRWGPDTASLMLRIDG